MVNSKNNEERQNKAVMAATYYSYLLLGALEELERSGVFKHRDRQIINRTIKKLRVKEKAFRRLDERVDESIPDQILDGIQDLKDLLVQIDSKDISKAVEALKQVIGKPQRE